MSVVDLFVSGHSKAGESVLSSPGLIWKERTTPFATSSTIHTIEYGGGVVVAAASGGQIARSADNGSSWGSLISNPFLTDNIRSLAYGNGVWVAVTEGNRVARSTDGGVSWGSLITNPFDGSNPIYTVGYGDGVFVAMADGAGTARSIDSGVTWGALITNPLSPTDVRTVAYGDGVWVAVADAGKLTRSSDGGITWGTQVYGAQGFSQPYGASASFRGVTYADKRFLFSGLLTGSAGITATSDYLEAGSGIVEQGSNANGEYVIFSSGLQMCWHSESNTHSTIRNNNIGTYGWSYYLDQYTWTLPKAFGVAPKAFCSATNAAGAIQATTTTTVTYAGYSAASALRVHQLFAIGQRA